MKHVLPPLPEGTVTFDLVTFGQYTPRGFAASVVGSELLGVPIQWLDHPDSRHLEVGRHGAVGAMVRLFDAQGRRVGTINIPGHHEPAPTTLRLIPAVLLPPKA